MTLPVPPPLVLGHDCFLRNGVRHRILSGALHYFRVPRAAWEDRLLKYRACGLNTVETYVAWNLHEPQPGRFDFTGELDLAHFIRLAGSRGLNVILRPGPYICAGWDLGGLPAWLLADPTMRLRTTHPGYLEAVARYFDRVIDEVAPLLAHNGGPVVAAQIENEYGSYGNSRLYLEWLERALIERGVKELLFTSNGPEDAMLQGGTLPHVFKTVNFGSRAREAFAKLRNYQPAGPLMCMEYWCGWFDHWGKPHHARGVEHAAATLDEILTAGGSVNTYMMHRGTNFGFMAGANQDERYFPTVTSYDYDAPLDERGEPTAKYHAFRDVFARHGAKIEPVPPTAPARDYGTITLPESASLFEHVASLPRVHSHDPVTQETLGQNHGFTLYRTRVSGPRAAAKLHVEDVHDRAHVYHDGICIGVLERDQPHADINLAIPEQGSRIEILVENLGRVNYGAIHDRKGNHPGRSFVVAVADGLGDLPARSHPAARHAAVEPAPRPRLRHPRILPRHAPDQRSCPCGHLAACRRRPRHGSTVFASGVIGTSVPNSAFTCRPPPSTRAKRDRFAGNGADANPRSHI